MRGCERFLACPACGGRLATKTNERPPRLICTACARPLPQSSLRPLLGELERHAPGLLALILLMALPLVLLAISPWMEQPMPRGRSAAQSGGAAVEKPRWDRRSGIVGRSMQSTMHNRGKSMNQR